MFRRLSFALILTALTLPALAETPLRRVRVDAPDARALALRLEREGYDVLHGAADDAALELVVNETEFAELAAAGYRPVVLEVSRPFRQIQAERNAGKAVPEGYPDYDALLAQMAATEAAFPDICRVVDLTATYGTPPTFQGRHLHALKISDNVELDEDELSTLIVANHHARELVPTVIALSVADSLTAGYGVDPTITALVDENEIWIAPTWNPDGYVFVFDGYNWWRKNMRDNGDGTGGVDLNRNYPIGWDDPCGGSTDTSDNTYRGPAEASESETRTMLAWSLDRRFARVIDLHSRGREVVYGYACWETPFVGFHRALASIYAAACGYGDLSYRPPSSLGEHYQWQFARMSAMAFVLETQVDYQPHYYFALEEATQVWPGLLWHLQKTIPVWGAVTDADTGEPLEATITLPGVTYLHGETHSSGGPHGRYQLFVPTNTYDVVFSAEGYEPHALDDLSVVSSNSMRLDVALTPRATAVPAGDGGPVVTVGPDGGVIRFALHASANVKLEVFDLHGARVRTLVDGRRGPGEHAAPWRGRDEQGRTVAAGRYLWRLTAGADVRTGKLLLVR